jgi:hypothetical protein
MRLAGSSKPPKQAGDVPAVAEITSGHTLPQSLVSFFPGAVSFVRVPETPPKKQQLQRVAGRLPAAMALTEAEQIALTLVRLQHPTAYYRRGGGGDLLDPKIGKKAEYTDMSEPCWSGKIHTAQNFRVFVQDNSVRAQCYGCKGTWRLGMLHDFFRRPSDVVINIPFLQRAPTGSIQVSTVAFLEELAPSSYQHLSDDFLPSSPQASSDGTADGVVAATGLETGLEVSGGAGDSAGPRVFEGHAAVRMGF